ncbi:MAG: zinc ribbon domain-containing protein [Luminiphilus sp.]|nr:zinc ribbon domain-containing protein [Luminiphilus sp.]
MSARDKMRKRLKLNRPSLRQRARPPRHRTASGARFSAANLSGILKLQHCTACQHIQYPPAELCGVCLADALVYRDTDNGGTLLAQSDLHHSLWEYFKRRLGDGPWSVGTVQLDGGPTMIVHLGPGEMAPGDRVQVFSHSDASQSAVLIAVPDSVDLRTREARRAIVLAMGLNAPAIRPTGA